MNAIFLRGSIPPKSEHPEKLLYDSVVNCEDVWTQLFYYMLKVLGGRGELLYQGGNRRFEVDSAFAEVWCPSFKEYVPPFKPDLIICRGGFPYYDSIVERYPKAKKVYYGAGRRFYPIGYDEYDLFLVDSERQREKIISRRKRAMLLLKPAALLFKPINVEKKYDVCFMANASQAKIKRHRLFLRALAGSELKVLNLGNKDSKLIKLGKQLGVNVVWGGWFLRKELPQKISQCKVGVCCSTGYDSCPRVIPEYLACGLPVVATKNMNFWHNKYINKRTGLLVSDGKLLEAIKQVIARKLNPINYYRRYLSLPVAAKYLASLL